VATILVFQNGPVSWAQDANPDVIFENEHKPIPVKGIPGNFIGKN
jgi:hypothetical protein